MSVAHSFGAEFYPTPTDLIDKMLEHVDVEHVTSILEPSAGKGDIIERIKEKRCYGRELQIDAVETDPELRLILAGKGHRPVGDDFLAFSTYRQYDTIIMNPPFSSGDKHMLHALRLQKDGGQVVCLLNAETIRNPYTRTRQELANLIEQYGGTVEYLQDTFGQAERRTDVDVALVAVTVPRAQPTSDILRNLVEARQLRDDEDMQSRELVDGDPIIGAVRRYEVEIEAGLKLIDEYEALKPVLSKSFSDKDRPMLELSVDGDRYGDLRNSIVRMTRAKYWRQLFQSGEFSRLFTSKTRDDYTKRIDDLQRYEFNLLNIRQMQIDISQAMLGSLDDMIVRLFDEFSSQYYDEQSKNIHYYNGWKTNKAWRINRKVITQLYLYTYGSLDLYKLFDKMADIHKVFAYLDGTLSTNLDDLQIALQAAKRGKTRKIELPYCFIDVFKKGTVHITFKDDRLLKKFNLIGSQRNGWLPPNYGTNAYDDLGAEHRAVVDSFEGADSYRDTVENLEYYSSGAALPLALDVGEVAEVAA